MLLLCACGRAPSINDSTSSHGGPVRDHVSFVDHLRARGVNGRYRRCRRPAVSRCRCGHPPEHWRGRSSRATVLSFDTEPVPKPPKMSHRSCETRTRSSPLSATPAAGLVEDEPVDVRRAQLTKLIEALRGPRRARRAVGPSRPSRSRGADVGCRSRGSGIAVRLGMIDERRVFQYGVAVSRRGWDGRSTARPWERLA